MAFKKVFSNVFKDFIKDGIHLNYTSKINLHLDSIKNYENAAVLASYISWIAIVAIILPFNQ